MESNWRWNVWELGLAYAGGTGAKSLAARLLPPFTGILTNNLNLFTTGRGAIYFLPGEVFPDIYWANPAFGSLANFPYGYPVEPDGIA